MEADQKNYNGLDYFKIAAALFVIAIHTGPLTTYSEEADYVITSIIGRLAVPYFFVLSGFFLYRKFTEQWRHNRSVLRRFTYRLTLLYVGSMLLYLPINLYAGHYRGGISAFELVKTIVFDGTFYHLWYLPAVIQGTYIVSLLFRKGSISLLLAATGLLYLIGLLGDSYYGLVEQNAAANSIYSLIFKGFDYTRNGLFFAPVFIAIGLLAARGRSTGRTVKLNAVFLIASLIALFIEAMILKAYAWPRHDSMYISLLPAVYFLFHLLLNLKGNSGVYVRNVSLWLYILHPLAIVLIRAAAKALGWDRLLIGNSVIHYIAVTILTFILSIIVVRILHVRGNQQPMHRAWSEINLNHLEFNLLQLKQALPPECKVMAVVKADAYGHGSLQVARKLKKSGVRSFAVAEISEAIALRKNGINEDILVFGETCESRFHELVRYRLQQTVVSAEYAKALNDYGRKIEVHVKVDTGMSRLGEWHENKQRIQSIYYLKNLRIMGTYSHLAAADSVQQQDAEFTSRQRIRFEAVIKDLRSAGLNPGKLHIQSSYGILNYPEAGYELARPGIALYGVLSNKNEVKQQLQLRPVLTLRARVVLVKRVEANRPIGYGGSVKTSQPSTIATLSIGYADGVPRELSENGGYVLIRGQRASMIGKICMDHLMVDVTSIAGVERGDPATLIGQDGDERIRAEEVAELCGTIANELLSRLGSRLQRLYK